VAVLIADHNFIAKEAKTEEQGDVWYAVYS
jgi:hypothetical protein